MQEKKPMTATEIHRGFTTRMDLRRRRAEALVHLALERLRPVISREQETEIYFRLFDLFVEEGVEILTDFHRQEIGLPPRDQLGWTPQEIEAYEARILQALTSPIVSVLKPTSLK